MSDKKTKKSKAGCWVVGGCFLALFSLTVPAFVFWMVRLRHHHEVAERVKAPPMFYTPSASSGYRFIDDTAGGRAFDTIETAFLKGAQSKSDLRYLSRKSGLKILSLEYKECDDKDMVFAGRSRDLTEIGLSDVSVTSTGLAELKHCSQLRFVLLAGKWLDDEALQGLAQVTQIESLILENTAITGEGLKRLHTLSQLDTLILFDCQGLKAGGLQQLSALPALESLTLENSPVDEAEFASLSRLRNISIQGTSWSQGLPEGLAGMNNVRSLTLENCPVTDEDLGQIAKMKNLQMLTIDDTKVTQAGLEQLLDHPELETVTVRSYPESTWIQLGSDDSLSHYEVEQLDQSSTRIKFQVDLQPIPVQ